MATFHPFPRLPFELRAQIWEMTVEPRTVEARIDYNRMERPLVSSTPTPAVIQACREARGLGLYQKALSELAQKDGKGRRYVWLNWDIDMLSIGTCILGAFEPVMPLVRRLKFERQNADEWWCRFESAELMNFINAEEMHVVCADGLGNWHGVSEDYFWPCSIEKVLCIDPDDGKVMRAAELDEHFDRILEEGWRREEEEEARRQLQIAHES